MTEVTTLKPPAKILNCNFDEGNFCNWENNATNHFKISSSLGHENELMPNFDKSTGTSKGKYIYVSSEMSSGKKKFDVNVGIISIEDRLEHKSPSCIQFWYYMRIDPQIIFGSLSVGLVNKYLKTIIRDHGEKWRFASIQIPANDSNKIEINATVSACKIIKCLNHFLIQLFECFRSKF